MRIDSEGVISYDRVEYLVLHARPGEYPDYAYFDGRGAKRRAVKYAEMWVADDDGSAAIVERRILHIVGHAEQSRDYDEVDSIDDDPDPIGVYGHPDDVSQLRAGLWLDQ